MHEMMDASAIETMIRSQKIQAPTLIPQVTEASCQLTWPDPEFSWSLSTAARSYLQDS